MDATEAALIEHNKQMVSATLATAIIAKLGMLVTPELAVKIKSCCYWEMYPQPSSAAYKAYVEAKAKNPATPWA